MPVSPGMRTRWSAARRDASGSVWRISQTRSLYSCGSSGFPREACAHHSRSREPPDRHARSSSDDSHTPSNQLFISLDMTDPAASVRRRPNHGTYAEGVERRHAVNQGTSLAEWFLDHCEELESDRYNRSFNGVVAVALLGEFRKNASLWRDCTSLNSWNASQDEDFRAYLKSWSSNLAGSNAGPRLPGVVAKRLGIIGTTASPFHGA